MRLWPLTTDEAIRSAAMWRPWMKACTDEIDIPESVFADRVATGQTRVFLIGDGNRFVGAVGVEIDEGVSGDMHGEALWLGGKNVRHWFEMMVDSLEAFFRAAGCVDVHTSVRPGLARLLRRRGYRHMKITLRRDLAP